MLLGKPSTDQSNPDWAPTQRMGHDKIKKQTPTDLSRAQRSQERAAKKIKIEAAKEVKQMERFLENLDSYATSSASGDAITAESGVGCQTDLTMIQIYEMEQCISNMTCELSQLKKDVIEANLSEESFKENEEKIKFYTGIPNFIILQQILTLCSPYIYSGASNVLTKFQELILVLMRLKLNMPFQDLGYRFKISRSTASRVFDKWIDILYVRLNFLIVWPERENLIASMPTVFQQNFGNRVAVIIDCFEVFVNRPSGLLPRAITWSNYKHHNTVKFLIGITPQGVISFISKAWGGRASDKHVTENCGILENLTPGDIVLADRGFDIADSVGLYQASLRIPSFTRGKKQLSPSEVEETRKIANVRIHVERVIGLVRRKYIILQSILPVELITVKSGEVNAPIDKIAKVCCALTNLSESVVPFD